MCVCVFVCVCVCVATWEKAKVHSLSNLEMQISPGSANLLKHIARHPATWSCAHATMRCDRFAVGSQAMRACSNSFCLCICLLFAFCLSYPLYWFLRRFARHTGCNTSLCALNCLL